MPISEIVLLVTALLATGVFASGLLRRLPIPYSVVLVVIGIGLSWLWEAWPVLEPVQGFGLTPDLVLYVFLPALIFESGLNLNARQLIKDIGAVLTLAVPALVLSTALIGFALWLVLPVDLMVALLFGALISATDPVAVIAIFKELGTPERLTILVEGESLLNDATAIVVVSILLALYFSASQASGLAIAGTAASQFLIVFLGGTLVGIGSGAIASWVLSRFANEPSLALIISLVLAYLSFVVAEHLLHVSGVMAVVAAAIVFGIFGMPRLAHETVELMHGTWEFVAHICNTLLFIAVGLLVDPASLFADLWYVLFAVVVVQAARAALMYGLLPATQKLFRLPKVTLGERHIMFWGGLKGGLAIAIVLSLPADLPGRELLLHLTLGVVLFTLLVNAPTIRPLIRKLGIDKLDPEERAELRRGIMDARAASAAILRHFGENGLLTRARQHKVEDETDSALKSWLPEAAGDDEFRHQRLQTLNSEVQELESLFNSGVLSQFAYLELRGEIVRKRDQIASGHRVEAVEDGPQVQDDIVVRAERALMRSLRERDWASGLLSYYQNRRLTHHLMLDIARILMAEAALKDLREYAGISRAHRQRLEQTYTRQLESCREQLSDVRKAFPEYFDRFEVMLSARSALIAALHKVRQAHANGSMTTKVYVKLAQRIEDEIARIPTIDKAVSALRPRELVELVPLFAGLPSAALDKIAASANLINYLDGDTIIGCGEYGDALYVVARGRAEASVQEHGEIRKLGELGAGDFFGEMALLGDSVRTADVRAITPCTLLRIDSDDVHAIAQLHHEVAQRLEVARAERRASNV